MIAEKRLQRHAVKIKTDSTEASGCLCQPSGTDYSYVFTAKHCLPKNLDSRTISITTEQGEKLNVRTVLPHSELDILVIIVDRVSELDVTPLSVTPELHQAVTIYGYPEKLREKSEQRENLSCKISFRHDDYFEMISDQIQFTFNTDVPENVRGFSGSGVFIESERYELVGIFTRLKASGGAYQKFCAYNLSVIDKFLLNNSYAALSSDSFSGIKKDPELLEAVFYLPYKKASDPFYFKRDIDFLFENYFLSQKHVWISGVSGVGKTNLVLSNLINNGRKFIFIDLSAQQNRSIQEYFDYINSEIIEQASVESQSGRKNIIERIAENLAKITLEGEQLVVFVDEVPISENDKFLEFVTNFITISERFFNQAENSRKIKWVICTRINPIENLQNRDDCFPNSNKANKNFHFKHLRLWSENELIGLLKILEGALEFSLSSLTQAELLVAVQGFPGKLKNTIERVLLEECSIQKAIELIKSEKV